jgi:hypothetical protein
VTEHIKGIDDFSIYKNDEKTCTIEKTNESYYNYKIKSKNFNLYRNIWLVPFLRKGK